MATIKHISSKNADYGAAEAYLTFEHDEFTMKPVLDGAAYPPAGLPAGNPQLRGGRFCPLLHTGKYAVRQEQQAGGHKEPPLYHFL